MIEFFLAPLLALNPIMVSSDEPPKKEFVLPHIATTTEPQKQEPTPPKQEEPKKEEPVKQTVEDTAEHFEPQGAYESLFMKTLLVLVSILVFIGLCIFLFKRVSSSRMRQMNYMKSIKVIEKRPISPKTLLYLVEVGDRRVLLSESQLEVREITTLDYPEEEKS